MRTFDDDTTWQRIAIIKPQIAQLKRQGKHPIRKRETVPGRKSASGLGMRGARPGPVAAVGPTAARRAPPRATQRPRGREQRAAGGVDGDAGGGGVKMRRHRLSIRYTPGPLRWRARFVTRTRLVVEPNIANAYRRAQDSRMACCPMRVPPGARARPNVGVPVKPRESRFLRAALGYGERGWFVFPLAPRTKRQPLTPHGFQDATQNLEQVGRWWTATPDAKSASGPVLRGSWSSISTAYGRGHRTRTGSCASRR